MAYSIEDVHFCGWARRWSAVTPPVLSGQSAPPPDQTAVLGTLAFRHGPPRVCPLVRPLWSPLVAGRARRVDPAHGRLVAHPLLLAKGLRALSAACMTG